MNQQLFTYLYSFAHRNSALDSIIIFLATDFALLAAFALLYFLYNHEDRKRGTKELAIVIGSGALAWVIAHIIKDLYPMPRPDMAIQAVMPLFAHGTGIDSFPSGHATFYSALATAIYFYHKKLGIFFVVCALIIGLARVMAGVHFPVDILGGFVLGIVTAFVMYLLFKKS